jgi:type IV pilus assembly protein PilX
MRSEGSAVKIINHSRKNQTGATLVFSLIILAVITLLSVASMRSSNSALKMAGSARDHAVAFQAAEAALTEAEQLVLNANYTDDDLVCRDSTSSRCFNTSCNNGLCFSGDVESITFRDECKIAKLTTSAEAWSKKSHWENNGTALPKIQIAKTHLTDADQLDSETLAVPYMVEFLCYAQRDTHSATDENNRNGGVPLYRVTVKSSGSAGRSSVMLQSVFKTAG